MEFAAGTLIGVLIRFSLGYGVRALDLASASRRSGKGDAEHADGESMILAIQRDAERRRGDGLEARRWP